MGRSTCKIKAHKAETERGFELASVRPQRPDIDLGELRPRPVLFVGLGLPALFPRCPELAGRWGAAVFWGV